MKLNRINYLFKWLLPIAIGMMLFQSKSYAESVQLQLNDVTQFQNDGWSCGIQSAYRVLKGGYGQTVDYVQMRSTVDNFWPFRVVLVPNVIEFNLNFEILKMGQPTPILASSLRNNYRSTAISQTVSTNQIKDLLWRGIPVMTLIQVGSEGSLGLNHAEGCIGPWVWGSCWGIYYSVDMKHPLLHWIVVTGYDDNYIYFKNTDNNLTYYDNWSHFESMRNWTIDIYNRDIANLINGKGAKPGDIVYFNESLPSSRVVKSGERYPALSVNASGFGRGQITSNIGLTCTSSCSTTVLNNSSIQLTATPETGTTFKGWSGACTGTGACNFSMNGTKSVTANFDNPAVAGAVNAAIDLLLDDDTAKRKLNVTLSGMGKITSMPGGIDCGATCSSEFDDKASVQLTAMPQPDYGFSGWSGACTGTATTCTVAVDADKTVTAQFVKGSVTTKTLTVRKGGTGSGTVISSPAGISCADICIASFTQGLSVTLTATPSADNIFTGWSGACTGTAKTCTVAMNDAKTTTANFKVAIPSISVANVSVIEGAAATTKNMVFAVKLNKASTTTINVNFATQNGTALAGSDYVAKSGTLSFAAGQVSKTVAVAVKGDAAVEPNETFSLVLSAPTAPYTLQVSNAIGTILNDD